MTAREVPAGPGTRAPIVVGMDASPASLAALAWAHDEAMAHGAPLVVVHVLDPRAHAASYAPTRPRQDEDALVAAETEALIGIESISPVEHVFQVGVPSTVLIERSRGARMLVLGHSARHHHGQDERGQAQAEPALGPVARACVTQAECPVVVLPESVEMPASPKEAAASAASSREPVHGGRALYPFQGRIPIAHQ
jgi:nucleotide-binding universal stress UspA family protein